MASRSRSIRRDTKSVLCGAVVIALVAVFTALASAGEKVVMRRDNLGGDFAFVDRFLELNWPHYYRPDEPLEVMPELSIDMVHVGRYDVDDDGQSELFVHVGYVGVCGSAGCTAYVFEKRDHEWVALEDIPRFRVTNADRRVDGEAVLALDVWTDPASGYKSVFSTFAGLRWTGTEYVYLGEEDVLELSALIPPDLANDGAESDARDFEFGHLMQYVGTRRRFHVMYDPAVKPALEALLGTEFSHLRLNMDRPSTIGYDHPFLVLKGSLRSVSTLEFGEHAILMVSAVDGGVHVGIDSGGVRTIYSHAETWD